MNTNKVNSVSALGTSIVAAVTFVIVAPRIEEMAISLQIIYAIFTTIGVFAVFSAFQYCLLRYFLKDILGKWYYATTPFEFSSYKDANFAIMTFYISKKGNLDYKVDLYPSRKGIEVSGSERSRGQAISRACRYEEVSRRLDLVFSVNYQGETGQATRDGRLFLRFVEAGHLEGDWVSEVSVHLDDSLQERQLSTGRMIADRPETFFKTIDKELKLAIKSNQ